MGSMFAHGVPATEPRLNAALEDARELPMNKTSGRADRTPGQRAGLDLVQIVKAARTIDVGKLSMQSLADKLNVDRKALNYHVKDRQSLLQLLARDAFSSGFVGTEVAMAADWQEACRLYARKFTQGVLTLGDLSEHLWFGETLTAWSLEPVEALFGHLFAAGFREETATRLVTMLATLCLGHARDVIQARHGSERPRPRFLKAALNDVDTSAFENLRRISNLNIDTYNDDQIDFSIEVFIRGALAILDSERSAGKRNGRL
jgi:TetR/AcrR family transcriptional regulator, tetracycline repressor protein